MKCFFIGLLLLLISASSVAGALFSPLWLNSEQQGDRLLQQHQPLAAARIYKDPLRRAYALSQAGQYADAARVLNNEKTAQANYNRGNALAHAGDLQGAIAAYQQALKLTPHLANAQYNLQLVKKHLPPASPPSRSNTSTGQSASSPQQSPHKDSAQPTQQPQKNAAATPTDTAKSQASSPQTPGSLSRNPATPSTPAPVQPVTPQSDLQREEQQWLRSLPAHPGSLLQQKFLLEYQARHADNPPQDH